MILMAIYFYLQMKILKMYLIYDKATTDVYKRSDLILNSS